MQDMVVATLVVWDAFGAINNCGYSLLSTLP